MLSRPGLFIIFVLTFTSCAQQQIYQKGGCTLSKAENRSFTEIKEIEGQIKQRSAQFDAEINEGPVDLISNKNYQELIALRSRYDEALKAFAAQLQTKKDDSVCLKHLFKEDLNFPELSDEK